MATITPWEVEGIVDYDRLIQEFGMQPFSQILDKVPNPNWLMRRNIIFGHRDYERIIDAILNKKPWAVMSGFMPSGLPHFGHKMTMDEIVWHQKVGGKAFVGIADMEAHAVRGLSWEKVTKIGFEYIKSIIALGLDENAIIYFQSASNYVKDLAFELSAEVNWSELKAIYGFTSETNLAKMFVTSVQAADILHPQLKEFGGPKPVVIPVGADQDPHIRLTRDLAARISLFSMERTENGLRIRSRKGAELLDYIKSLDFEKRVYEEHVDLFGDVVEIENEVRNVEIEIGGYAFIPPSSTYHKFTTGLTGGKMSSSKPESYISLLDEPKEAVKKVMRAFTGGRISAEEQRRLGGEPEKCTIFELYSYHLIKDDAELNRIYEECKGGKLLCGKCKKMAAELVEEFLKEHQEKRNQIDGELDKYNIIARSF
ncbi:MAG: tryptophan--tRNA ligase [Archaeoglobaceae archaeon]|nr:tryptophan--tRNA ligase [Archaeoglobaceae archaeon]